VRATTIRAVATCSLVALVASACSSGSSKSNASSTTGSTTTTHSPKKIASHTDARLARAVTLTAADLGPTWRPYKNPRGVIPATRGCGFTRTGPLAQVGIGARYAGPQMKFKANRSYASSTTVVFPDSATAGAWIEVVETTAYKACRRRAFEAQLRHQVKSDRIVRTGLHDPHVGTTVPGGSVYVDFTRYNGQYRSQGHYYTNASYDVFVYQHGRTVVTFELDRETGRPSDPRARSVEATLAQGITKVLARAARSS
jgi:hypothetical protein